MGMSLAVTTPSMKSYFVICAWLVLSLAAGTTRAQDYTKSTTELNALRDEIKKIKSVLEKDVGARDKGRANLLDVEQKLVKLEREQRDTGDKIKSTEAQILDLGKKRSALEEKSRQLTNGMAGLARATYIMGRQEYTKLLLQQQKPEKLNRSLVYYRYLAESRLQRVNQVNANALEITRLTALTKTHSDELRHLQQQLSAEQAEAEQLRGKREHSLAAIQAQINDRSKEMQRLQADEKRLIKLLDALQRESQRQRELAHKRELERQRKQQAKAREKIQQKQKTTVAKANPIPLKGGKFPQMKGRLRLPVNAPISAQFGQTNQESGTKWDGVWFSAPENTAVQAIYSGQIAYADWFRGFGLLLIIDHGDGYMSLYSHNKELHKSLGDSVKTGEVIARVGSTGGLPKPGLYFEVRENGQPRNPLIWCKA